MIGDPDQEKVARVMRAMMTMTKFDIAELEKAYADA
jgi:predicted 3-demethylubiquinone-9 3-methyltransferase (glyoxalase superfamily)